MHLFYILGTSQAMSRAIKNKQKNATTENRDYIKALMLSDEIYFYNRYKDMIRQKYEQKQLLRYKCELNYLNQVLRLKLNELDKLRNEIYNKENNKNKESKIFYSSKYKKKTICNKESSLHSTQSNAQNSGQMENVESNEMATENQQPKIFYSKKYREHLANASSTSSLKESPACSRTQSSSNIDDGSSQFERFKKMYIKWSEKSSES